MKKILFTYFLSVVSLINLYAQTYQYISKFGTSGSGNGQFNAPNGIAFDGSGNIYISDTQNERIQKFDNNGNYILQWGSAGSGNGEFLYPYGVAVNGSGNVFVADLINSRVQVFDGSGNYISEIGGSGSGDGQFNNVVGVAIDASGNLYVSDYNNHRIQKFDASGNFITKWGTQGSGNGQFQNPSCIAIDGSGNVFVADRGNNRVQKFNASGTFITKWTTANDPFGIAVDANGNVFVGGGSNVVEKYDANGNFLVQVGSGAGTGNGQFSNPNGLAIGNSGNVYVVDNGNNRVQVFAPVSSSVNSWNGSSWSLGSPTAGSSAVIAGNYANTNASISLANLTINSGITLYVGSGKTLTVSNSLVNLGTLFVENGGTLLLTNAPTGSGTYKIKKNGGYYYNYWSSPVANSPLFGARTYLYNESARQPLDYTSGWTTTGGNFVTAKGYAIYSGAEHLFTGTPNVGSFNISVSSTSIGSDVTKNGWNLVGNPYPAPLDIAAFVASNPGVTGVAYFWSDQINNYLSYNTGTIPVAQGFFVKAGSNGTVSFLPSHRISSSASLFRTQPVQRFHFSISSKNGQKDITQVDFNPNASDSYDFAYDGYKMKGGSSLQLYSHIQGQTYDYSINALADLTSDKTVDLGLDAAAGSFTITLDSASNTNATVYLVDKQNQTSTKLGSSGYSFTTTDVSGSNRFSLVFRTSAITHQEEATSLVSQNLAQYANRLVLQNGDPSSSLEIVDSMGKIVTHDQFQNGQYILNLPSGVYMIRVINEKGVLVKKVAVE